MDTPPCLWLLSIKQGVSVDTPAYQISYASFRYSLYQLNSDHIPFTRYNVLTIGIKTNPAFKYKVRFAMFTNSHAIQQSHFFNADNVWAVRINTVTQQSR